jgi:hypothetical protein
LYLEKGGRSIVSLREYDGEWEEYAIRALTSMIGGEEDRGNARFRRLVLETVPSELMPLLKQYGFVPTPKGLAKYA